MALSPNFVQQMYVAYFGRPADPQGLAYFAQLNEDALIKTFAASAESQALFNGASGTGAISAIYQNLFNRDAEPAGLQYWAGLINNGQITAVAAALSILRGATNDDLTAVSNKVTVANLFTSHVDTTAEIVGYSGDAAAALARKFLKAVDSSNTSVNTAQNTVDQAVTSAAAAVTPAKGFALTTNSDTLVGGSGNDAFTASNPGEFGSGDNINGGDGNDSLTVTGETGGINSGGITIANVETASFTAGGSINLDTTGWTGLSSLTATGTGVYVLRAGSGVSTTANASAVGGNQVVLDGGADVTVNATGLSGGSVTVGSNTGPTGAVVVNASGSVNSVFVRGGTSETVSAAATSITAMGTAATTAVTLNATTGSNLNVLDVNANTSTVGTISSITAGNFGSLNINDSGLTSLTLTQGAGNVNINNGGAGAAVSRTLNLSESVSVGISGSAEVTDAGVYTTVNLSTVANHIEYVGALHMSAVTNLNISGEGLGLDALGLTAMSSLQTVTASGSVPVYLYLTAGHPALSLIDASASTGGSNMIFFASQTKFVGGTGVDVVLLGSSTVSQDVDMGGGDDQLSLTRGTTSLAANVKGGGGNDTLAMAADDAAAITAAGGVGFSSKISGFETLSLGGTGTLAIDMALFGGASNLSISGNQANITVSHFASGGTLTVADSTGNVTLNGDFSGANDTLNLQLNGSGGLPNFIPTYAMPIQAAGVENINIRTQNTSPNPTFSNIAALNLQDSAAKTITIISNNLNPNPAISTYTGTITLALTSDSTALASVDASAMLTGNLTWTSGSLANAAVVKGSANGGDVVNMAADANAVTFTGGTGNTTITTGAGNDTISVGGGANIVNVGSGTDRVNITAVNAASATTFTSITGMSAGDSVNLGGGANAMGSQITDLGTLAADLAAAAAGAGSSAAPVLHWFNFGGDTYIVEDMSSGASFVSGTDMVVKLVGTLNVATANVAGGVITL